MVLVKDVLRLTAWGLAVFVSALLMLFQAHAQTAPSPSWRHAISLTGEPKYGPDFRHPDYVNPKAPIGGRVRMGANGSFDNFNPFISGVKGKLAASLMKIYEPLLMVSLDEPTTEYGLLAEAVAFPSDFSEVSFRLRPEARWHDGRAVTADDVIFSFETWKRLSPQFNLQFLKVRDVVKVSDREVRFIFSESGDAALPLYVGQMSILPKHWWEGADSKGMPRDVGATTLEPPLGSGPYRVKSFDAGRTVIYERVADYWGRHVPIRVGTENFERLEIEYFRDANVMFEAFKADLIDLRRENSLKSWAVGYGFPAVTDKRITRATFGIERIGIVRAFVFNLRKAKFENPRLRQALAMAFNFDDVNRQVFHALMSRPGSYFPHTEFEAKGMLSADERRLLQGLPGAPAINQIDNVGGQTAQASSRSSLFNALELLKEAGFRLKDGRLLDDKGQQFTLEFVLEDPVMERVATVYGDQLAKLGIAVQIRLVDEVQYQNRMRAQDFDIAAHGWVQGHAPGSEVREYFATDSADKRGTNNLGGLKNPLVDALVEKLVLATDRAEKVAAGRLLDRVLHRMVIGVPVMTEDREFVAYWDRFGRPDVMPRYGATAFPSIWWWDAAKAEKTGGKNR
jgi:microcin C transport system substrate-binding protein